MKKEVTFKNQINANNSTTKKAQNVHINISIPNLTEISTTAVSSPRDKKNKNPQVSADLLPPDEIPVKEIEAQANPECVDMPSKESSQKANGLKQKQNRVDKVSVGIKALRSELQDLLTNMSNVSTPSEISQIDGINGKPIEEPKAAEEPLPESKFHFKIIQIF